MTDPRLASVLDNHAATGNAQGLSVLACRWERRWHRWVVDARPARHGNGLGVYHTVQALWARHTAVEARLRGDIACASRHERRSESHLDSLANLPRHV